ncbi:tyrosine-type recombinase/integrase [Vibrio sp. RC27]
MALTQKEITGLKPKSSAFYVWDDTGTRGTGRLGVKVMTSGSKAFVFRYFKNKQRAFIQLGRFPELSLSNAREVARNYGLLLQQGLDPKQKLADDRKAEEKKRREESQKGTIKQLFHAYTDRMKREGKRTYKAVLASLEKEVYPIVPPDTKARDFTKDDSLLILSGMIERGAPVQSNRVRSYLLAAFNYGINEHENDPANLVSNVIFSLNSNPLAQVKKQKKAEKEGKHYLKMNEVIMLIDDLNNEYQRFKMGDSIRNLILLCLYTGGQRPYELAASKWESVDWQQKTLLITPDISKNKREHLIPLTDSALEVLERQLTNNDSDFIFPHRLKDDAHIRLDSLAQSIDRYRKATPHTESFIPRDLRRTAKTLMGALGLSKEIRDRLQNHALNDVSAKHYDQYKYLPEKRIALEAWEQRLNQSAVDNVSEFRRQS